MIEQWLEKFKIGWITYDIDSVLSLLADAVEYHETPFHQLADKTEIKEEWQVIMQQTDLSLDYQVVSSDSATSTVTWDLGYTQDEIRRHVAGVWIITLNAEGKCTYFYQVCEAQT